MMTNKKIFIISTIITIIIIGIFIFLLNISKPNQITPPPPTPITKSDVTISTDKNAYNKGETINILMNNSLDEKILISYSFDGDRFWDIEYYKDGEWKGHQEFQLTNRNVGDNCSILAYELSGPVELQSQDNFKFKWNQKICPFGARYPGKPSIVQYIGSGKYRLIFNYGFKVSEDDSYRISDSQEIYSNVFTIK